MEKGSDTAFLDCTYQEPFDGPSIEIALNGNYGRIRFPGAPAPDNQPAPRGTIKRFSKAARKRLIDTFAKVDRSQVHVMPLLITLTYPNTWPAETKECKRHLDSFCKRLIRGHKDAAIVWKLEYQKRGAPHFHLLVFGVPFLHHVEVARDWHEILGHVNEATLRAGSRVERCRTWRGVTFYAAKYLGKVGEEIADTSPGRFWGIYGRANLPTAMLVRAMAWGAAYRLRRYLWRIALQHGYKAPWRGRFSGLTIYLDSALLLRLLDAANGP